MASESNGARAMDARIAAVARPLERLHKLTRATDNLSAAKVVSERLRRTLASGAAALALGSYRFPGKLDGEVAGSDPGEGMNAARVATAAAGQARIGRVRAAQDAAESGRRFRSARGADGTIALSPRESDRKRRALGREAGRPYEENAGEGELARVMARVASMKGALGPLAQREAAAPIGGRGARQVRTSSATLGAIAEVVGAGPLGAAARGKAAQFSAGTLGRRFEGASSTEAFRAAGAGRERLRGLAPHEFAKPRAHGDSSRAPATAGMSVAIHSSPTVVIQRGELATDDLERRVVDALKSHREQLYSELEREFARRRRTEFERA